MHLESFLIGAGSITDMTGDGAARKYIRARWEMIMREDTAAARHNPDTELSAAEQWAMESSEMIASLKAGQVTAASVVGGLLVTGFLFIALPSPVGVPLAMSALVLFMVLLGIDIIYDVRYRNQEHRHD